MENGWVYKLKNDSELKNFGVVIENYAFGFATTSQCEQVLVELLKHHKYDIIVYNAGLVDILVKTGPIHLVEEAMRRSIELCLKHTPIVFFGFIDFTCWMVRRNEAPNYITSANELFQRIANSYPIMTYEFLNKDLLCHEKCNYGDWIHPNEFGVEIIYQNVKREILKVVLRI